MGERGLKLWFGRARLVGDALSSWTEPPSDWARWGLASSSAPCNVIGIHHQTRNDIEASARFNGKASRGHGEREERMCLEQAIKKGRERLPSAGYFPGRIPLGCDAVGAGLPPECDRSLPRLRVVRWRPEMWGQVPAEVVTAWRRGVNSLQSLDNVAQTSY